MANSRGSVFGYLNKSMDSKLTSPAESLECVNLDLGEGIIQYKKFTPNSTAYLSTGKHQSFDYIIASGSETGWLDADDGAVSPVANRIYRKAKNFSTSSHVEQIGVKPFEDLSPSRYWNVTLSTINEAVNPYGITMIGQIREDFEYNIPSNYSCQAHRSLEDAQIVVLVKVLFHVEHGATDYYVSSYLTLSLPVSYNDYGIPYNFPHIDSNFYNNGSITLRNMPKADSFKYIGSDKISGIISTSVTTFQAQPNMAVAYASVDKSSSLLIGDSNADLDKAVTTDTSDMIYNDFLSLIFDPLESEQMFYLNKSVTVNNINDVAGEITTDEVVSAAIQGIQVYAKYRYPYSYYGPSSDICKHVSVFFKMYDSATYSDEDLTITIPTLSLSTNAYFLDYHLYETSDGDENDLMVDVQSELSTTITVDQVYEDIDEATYVLTMARDTLILDDDDEPVEVESEPTESFTVSVPSSVSATKITVQVGDDTAVYDDWEKIYIYRYSAQDTFYYRLAEITPLDSTETDPDGNLTVVLYDTFRSLLYREDDDGNLVTNYTLESENNGYPYDAKYMAVYNNKIFLVDNDNPNVIRYSKTGYADYFPSTFIHQFDDEITGMAIISEILIVGTKSGLYAIYGNSEDDFVIKTISKNYNVMDNSMLSLDNYIIFASPKDGFYAMTTGEIRKISYQLGDDFSSITSATNCNYVDNRWYFLQYTSGENTNMFVYDTKNPGWHTQNGATTVFEWKSADLDFGQPAQTKKLLEIAIEYKGNIQMIVYKDDSAIRPTAFSFPEKTTRGWMRRRISNLFGYRFNIKFVSLDSTSEIYDYRILNWRKGR